MTRQTSIEAYRKIKHDGLLSERRWQVYDILFEYGPLTGAEAAIAYRKKYGASSPSNPNILTRLGELRDQGVAEEIKETICSITGQTVILWDVTERLPDKIKKKPKQKCLLCKGTGYLDQ